MDYELVSLNKGNILKEEEIITIYIGASILPEKDTVLKDFVHQFNSQQEPVPFEGDFYKVKLFERYFGLH